NAAHIRMGFEFLKPRVRIKQGIQIIEPDHEADRNASIGHVVDETTAKLLVTQRPSHRVDDSPARLLFFRDILHFLDTDGKNLRIALAIQIEFLNKLLRQGSAGSFGKNRNLCPDVDPGLEVRSGFPVFVDTFVTGSYTGNSVALDQQIGSGKS